MCSGFYFAVFCVASKFWVAGVLSSVPTFSCAKMDKNEKITKRQDQQGLTTMNMLWSDKTSTGRKVEHKKKLSQRKAVFKSKFKSSCMNHSSHTLTINQLLCLIFNTLQCVFTTVAQL